MRLYPLFLLMATMTVLSPGPGVMMTLTNALRYGMKTTLGGILGISFGALVVAAISATSLGVVLATSAFVFTVVKLVGAAYLVYLGVRLWRAPAFHFQEPSLSGAGFGKRFLEGMSLQLTNPKVIFFFMSIFPQFIDHSVDYMAQFMVQVLTYSVLVIIIHCLYALFAQKGRLLLTSKRGGRMMNRCGGATFIFFGVALAAAKR